MSSAATRSKSPRELYESELALIQRVIDWICRRHAMRNEKAEDFSSWVHIRLLDKDCAILGKFRGKSKLSTYLTTVINNLYKDYVIAQDVKWRPSAIAKRLGWVAVALETQTSWHGHSASDAMLFVRQQLGATESDEELEALLSQLPVRYRRSFTDESKIDGLAADASTSDGAERQAIEPKAEDIARSLTEAMAELDAGDRVILRLRFREGQKVVAIARALGVEARLLYPRIESLLRGLQKSLEGRGVLWSDVEEILGWDVDLPVRY